jgi:hypothetical protein
VHADSDPRRRPPPPAARPGRAGFFGPFPTYTRRTRGGSRVTVSGCCLPIPFALTVGALAGARALLRR